MFNLSPVGIGAISVRRTDKLETKLGRNSRKKVETDVFVTVSRYKSG